MFRCAFTAKQLALRRLEHPLQNFATLGRPRIGHPDAGHVEALLGVPLRVFVTNTQRRLRYEAKPPPFEIWAELKHLCHGPQRGVIAFPRHHAFVLVFHFCFAGPQLAKDHHDGLQHVQRLETGNDNGFPFVHGDPFIRTAADHCRNVSRPDERIQPHIGGVENRADGRNDGHMVAEDRKVLDALGPGANERKRCGWRGGLEADGEEHNMFVRIGPGQLQRVRRRVHDANIGAARLVLQRAAVCSRHTHHVAECGKHHVWILRDSKAIIDPSHGQHADRAAGPVNQFDVRGQHILEAKTIDGVRVPAAYLHQPVVPLWIDKTANLIGRPVDDLRIAKLIYKSHSLPPGSYIFLLSMGLSSIWFFMPIQFFETVSLHLLHSLLGFTQHGKGAHLVHSVLFADLGHGETYMNQHPVAQFGHVILQQAKINLAAHADYFHCSEKWSAGNQLDDFSWDGQTHLYTPVTKIPTLQ